MACADDQVLMAHFFLCGHNSGGVGENIRENERLVVQVEPSVLARPAGVWRLLCGESCHGGYVLAIHQGPGGRQRKNGEPQSQVQT
eukprot:6923393-Pyramimonas_sp.AAC.1